MTKEYIENEIEKIMTDNQFPSPLNLAMSAIWLIANLKGTQLKILDIGKFSALADYFILASAQNSIQAESMADEISFYLKKYGTTIRSREGSKESDWILLDLGDVIVHIFLESSRQVYDLDGLWKNAPHVNIPENFYYGAVDEVIDAKKGPGKETLDYF